MSNKNRNKFLDGLNIGDEQSRNELLRQVESHALAPLVTMTVKEPESKSWEWMTFVEAHWDEESFVTMEKTLLEHGASKEEAAIYVRYQRGVKQWKNDTYQVAVYRDDGRVKNSWNDWPEMVHLSIKRNDREPLHDWRDLWAIKNCLVGEENEALELYPAESRLVDGANQYHLWVFVDPEVRLPFGMTEKKITGPTAAESVGAKQREFPEGSKYANADETN